MKIKKNATNSTNPLKKREKSPKKRDLLMLKKESKLLLLFAVKPWQFYTENELKAAYGTKSKSYVELFLEKYVKESILKTEQVGKTTIYALNLSSSKARVYAGTILEFISWSKSNIPYSDMQKLIDKIPYPNHITLITGSYAKGTQHDKSDIDIVIIIEDSCEPKKVTAELKLQSELNIPPVHLYVFRNSKFLEMLKNHVVDYAYDIVNN